MTYLSVSVFSLFYVIFLHAKPTHAKKIAEIDQFQFCPGYENSIFVYKNAQFSFDTVSGEVFGEYDIDVKENMPGPIESQWVIEKCASQENPNTCKIFYRFTDSKYCNLIAQRKQSFSGFLTCIKPELKCPIKKAYYKARNCSIVVAGFNMFPLREAYWKFTITFRNKSSKKEYGCIRVQASVRETMA